MVSKSTLYGKICSVFILCVVAYTFYILDLLKQESYRSSIESFLFPLSLLSYALWTGRRILCNLSYVFCLAIVLDTMNIRCGPSTVDLLSATRSNLFTIRLAIKKYIQNNTYPPQPTSSTNTNSNKTKSHSLENILTNQSSFGDGTEYIQGSIPSEYLSDSFGNNFVCVVKDIHAYKKDQSKFQSCLNPHNLELPNYSNGYVYFPKKGLIRLNFKVTGDDFMKGKQQKLSQLENISIQPTTNENIVVHNYPVQW